MSLCSNRCVPLRICIAQKMIVLWMKSSGGLLLTLPLAALTIVHNNEDSLGQISKIAFRVPSYQECVRRDTQYLNGKSHYIKNKNKNKNPQIRRSWGKVLELLFFENTCTYSPSFGGFFKSIYKHKCSLYIGYLYIYNLQMIWKWIWNIWSESTFLRFWMSSKP